MKKVSEEEFYYMCDHIFKSGWEWENLYDSNRYYTKDKKEVISIFDHWLSDKELLDKYPTDQNFVHKKQLIEFYFDIYDHYSLYFALHRYDGRGLMSFRDKEEYLDYVNLSLDGRCFMSLLIPDLKIIISGWYGYNLLFFHTDPELKIGFEKVIQDHGLHILDKKGLKKAKQFFLTHKVVY